MPGMGLKFKCKCGFQRSGVTVGATERGHYLVAMCTECQQICSIFRLSGNKKSGHPGCRKCGNPLLAITDPGAWGPANLQKKFGYIEPWLIEGAEDAYEELTENEAAHLFDIRILCPACGTYSLRYETELFWD